MKKKDKCVSVAFDYVRDRYIDVLHDQYVWVGDESGKCFGSVSNLRDIRKLHAALGEVIKKRARK